MSEPKNDDLERRAWQALVAALGRDDAASFMKRYDSAYTPPGTEMAEDAAEPMSNIDAVREHERINDMHDPTAQAGFL